MAVGSLVVVGTGIQVVGQVTSESLGHMKTAEKLFYLAADPLTEAWIQTLNSTTESLKGHYREGKPRVDTYRDMVARILAGVQSGLKVCAAFYGHPGICVDPSHEAIRLARQQGFKARMLPGISAQDCLFADLDVDPVTGGCQSFDATDFLIRRRRFDPAGSLILWQIGLIGELSVGEQTAKLEGLRVLVEVLRQYLPDDHEVVVYEAARYPGCAPGIERVVLSNLLEAHVSPRSTLYVKPRVSPPVSREMLDRLGISH